MNDRPKARTEQLISERIDDELVIYDQLNHVAHCLSHDAVLVWDHCDGRLTESEIAHRLTLSLEAVQRAVGALNERGLLDESPGPTSGYSRRQAAIRIARIGSAVLAGPLVYWVDVGSAAAASSHLAAGCILTSCGSCTSTGSCSSLCGSAQPAPRRRTRCAPPAVATAVWRTPAAALRRCSGAQSGRPVTATQTLIAPGTAGHVAARRAPIVRQQLCGVHAQLPVSFAFLLAPAVPIDRSTRYQATKPRGACRTSHTSRRR